MANTIKIAASLYINKFKDINKGRDLLSEMHIDIIYSHKTYACSVAIGCSTGTKPSKQTAATTEVYQ